MVSNILGLQNAKAYCFQLLQPFFLSVEMYSSIIHLTVSLFVVLRRSGWSRVLQLHLTRALYSLRDPALRGTRSTFLRAGFLRHVGVGRSAGRKEEGKDG